MRHYLSSTIALMMLAAHGSMASGEGGGVYIGPHVGLGLGGPRPVHLVLSESPVRLALGALFLAPIEQHLHLRVGAIYRLDQASYIANVSQTPPTVNVIEGPFSGTASTATATLNIVEMQLLTQVEMIPLSRDGTSRGYLLVGGSADYVYSATEQGWRTSESVTSNRVSFQESLDKSIGIAFQGGLGFYLPLSGGRLAFEILYINRRNVSSDIQYNWLTASQIRIGSSMVWGL